VRGRGEGTRPREADRLKPEEEETSVRARQPGFSIKPMHPFGTGCGMKNPGGIREKDVQPVLINEHPFCKYGLTELSNPPKWLRLFSYSVSLLLLIGSIFLRKN
jgi:hypothetical protein